MLEQFYQRVPILGVCLGFQCIVSYFGGNIIHGYHPVHGHTTQLRHTNEGIFQGLPQNFNVMRYHSLIADGATFPNCLKITAKTMKRLLWQLSILHFRFLVCNIILNLF